MWYNSLWTVANLKGKKKKKKVLKWNNWASLFLDEIVKETYFFIILAQCDIEDNIRDA